MIERQKKIYLCRPNGKILAQLNGLQTDSVKYEVNAKDYNNITFNVDRFIIIDGKEVETNGYEDLHVGMNILLEDCDMFQMQEPTLVNDGIKEYKVVKANSIEYEFQEKNWIGLKVNTGKEDSMEYLLPNNTNSFGIVEQNNYIMLYQGNNSGRTDHSLLHYIIQKVPGWSIDDDDIDGTLWDKKITIDEDNINLYALLTSVIGPKAECIFLFDTINKKIKAIGKDSLNESYFDTNIFISMRNLAQHIEVQTNEDSVYTVFNVTGDDDLDVGSVNYNDIYVYDLSYFMSEPWMSNETAEKIQAWVDWRDEHRDEFIELNRQQEEINTKIKEIINQCPNDGDDWQQWDQTNREDLLSAKEMYISYLNAMREDVDPDPAYDNDGNYIPRINYEENYESFLLDQKKGYYTYIEIRDFIIPNIDIAYANKGKTDEEKLDYVKTYETTWELFGISLLKGKEELYIQSLEQLDAYKKPWDQLTPSEKTKHTNEGQYNIKHDEYQEINDELLPGLRERLSTLRSQVEELQSGLETVKSNINDLVIMSNISNAEWQLDQDEINLFTQLCKYTDYTNNNIFITTSDDTISMLDIQKELYDDAVSKLSEVSQPQYTFSVTSDNFLDIPEFSSWKENFELLRFMRVGIRDDYSIKLRLIGYTTNPCEIDQLLSVDFSNFITSKSGRSDLTELLDTENISPSKNSISIGELNSKSAEEYATKLFYMMSRSGFLSSKFGNTATVTSTNSSFTGISTANLIKMYATSGYITDAIMSEAKVTDYLDAVKINAATVEAGTLIADRILLKNDASAIIYQLNNLGSLVSEESKTLDGYILTDRSILADKIVANSITANELTVDNITGTHGWINLHDGTFWYGGQNTDNTLSWNGNTLAVSGTLTARDGNIGGYNVTTLYNIDNVGETTANYGHVFYESLYSHSANATYEYEVGMTTGQTPAGVGWQLPEKQAIYVNRIAKDARWDTSVPMFYVRNDGKLFANNVELSGGQIYSSNYSYTSGNYADNGMLIDLSNGLMRSKNLYSDGQGNLSITGTVTATTGKIGCWIISNNEENTGTSEQGGHVFGDNSLYTHSSIAWDATDQKNYQYEVGMKGDSQPGHLAFYVKRIVAGQPWSTAQDIFFVRQNGALRATRGDIGGWSIDSHSIYTTPTGTNYRVTLYDATNTVKDVLVVRTGDGTTASPYSYPFWLRATGELHAEKATITGTINATSGTFGNGTNKITIGTNGNNNANSAIYSGMSTLDNTSNDGFYIGTNGIALGKGKFKVTSAGALTATNADIQGKITSSNGTIGGWTINSSGLTSSNGEMILDKQGEIIIGDVKIGNSSLGVGFFGKAMSPIDYEQYWETIFSTDVTMGHAIAFGTQAWFSESAGCDEFHGKFRTLDGRYTVPIGNSKKAENRIAYIGADATKLYINGLFGDADGEIVQRYITHSGSDIRLKTNIKNTTVNNAIDIINRINIYSFTWKSTNKWQKIGFIADQLDQIDNNLTIGGGYTDTGSMDVKSVNTFYLQGYEVKAIQELSAKIDELEKQIKELKSRI